MIAWLNDTYAVLKAVFAGGENGVMCHYQVQNAELNENDKLVPVNYYVVATMYPIDKTVIKSCQVKFGSADYDDFLATYVDIQTPVSELVINSIDAEVKLLEKA